MRKRTGGRQLKLGAGGCIYLRGGIILDWNRENRWLEKN